MVAALRHDDPRLRSQGFDLVERALGYWQVHPPGGLLVESEKRAEIRTALPVIDRALAAGATQRHAIVLRHLGVTLDSEPSRAWLPALYQAAMDPDAGSYGNALRLIERIVGLRGARDLGSGTWRSRQGAVKAWFEDWELPTESPK